jgi:hypothetical protein
MSYDRAVSVRVGRSIGCEAADPAADWAPRRSTLVAMTAVVWHYWIAVPLAVSAVIISIMLIAGYVGTVSRARYPRD